MAEAATKRKAAPKTAAKKRAAVARRQSSGKRGQLKAMPVDEIELLWFNTWGPRPVIDTVSNLIPDDHGRIDRLGLLAMDIHRCAGSRGETLVEWGVVLPCGRCWGRVKADRCCRFCSGKKHRSDAWAVIYTDIDANLIEEANR